MFENTILLLPSYGGMYDKHVLSLSSVNCEARHVFGAPIDQARSYLIQVALQTEKDVFVFVDADISFEPNDLERLVADCDRTKAIVSGIYTLKNGTNKIVAHAPNPEVTPDGLIKAEMIGMGFCAIHREAINTIAQSMERVGLARPSEMVAVFPFFLPMLHNKMWIGEDFAFCVRANAASVPIYLNHDILVTHWGLQGYKLQK